jgi:DNA-binding response OmpR family regulator
MKNRILVVDDEPDVIELVSFNLTGSGFEVVSAENGLRALQKVRQSPPDLIVLDLMMPELDGMEVCKILRRDPATATIPILMLTAKAGEVDRILGLEMGADDYLTKPFSIRELVLRVKNLIRRRQGDPDEPDRIVVGALLLDVSRHLVMFKDRKVDLTALEFKLLSVLMQRGGRVQSREQLLRDVWNYEQDVDSRTVDTHIRRVREKLGPAAKYIDTVRNVGYRIVHDPP